MTAARCRWDRHLLLHPRTRIRPGPRARQAHLRPTPQDRRHAQPPGRELTPQNPDETQDDEERSGARTKRRRTTILILVALILGYPAYKEDVFATVGVDVKQVARTAQ